VTHRVWPGLVGPAPEPAIDRTALRLPTSQYIPQTCEKQTIVLHHTVGGSARSTYRWWTIDRKVGALPGDQLRVGTAYLVERDGTIYETFPPECWAFHVGLGDGPLERRTIGIELCSEGALTRRGDELWGIGRSLGMVDKLFELGRVYRIPQGWRGFEWFDAYDEPQIDATCRLVRWLCERFGIQAALPRAAEWLGPADRTRWAAFAGVVHHALLRPDKSDLHPGFPEWRLARLLGAWPMPEASAHAR
jgi:N-acetyl-anhydromuramyl-L-alanine amidase AmpD